jgi:hypothetical protein
VKKRKTLYEKLKVILKGNQLWAKIDSLEAETEDDQISVKLLKSNNADEIIKSSLEKNQSQDPLTKFQTKKITEKFKALQRRLHISNPTPN